MDKNLKAKDVEKLKDFIAEKKPHVVAVTSESRCESILLFTISKL